MPFDINSAKPIQSSEQDVMSKKFDFESAKPLINEAVQSVINKSTDGENPFSFVKKIGEFMGGAGKSILNTARGVGEAGTELGLRLSNVAKGNNFTDSLNPEQLQLKENLLPTEQTANTGAENAGMITGDIAQFLIPSPAGKGKLVGNLANKAIGLAKNAIPRIAQDVALTTAQTGGDSTAMKEQAIGSTIAQGVVESIPIIGKIAPKLVSKALETYNKALYPTKEVNKRLAKQITPELIARGEVGNLQTLYDKSTSKLTEFGTKIDEKVSQFIEPLNEQTITRIKSIPDQIIAQLGDDFSEAKPIVEKAKMQIEQAITKRLNANGIVTGEDIINIRRQLDDVVAKNKGFGKDLNQTNIADTYKAIGDEIRTVVAKINPELDAINKEYSFWNKVKDVTDATLTRSTGQQKTVSQILSNITGGSAGAVAGYSSGDGLTPEGIAKAMIGAYLGTKAQKLLTGGALQTRQAVYLDKLGKAISNNNAKDVAQNLKQILSGLIAQ